MPSKATSSAVNTHVATSHQMRSLRHRTPIGDGRRSWPAELAETARTLRRVLDSTQQGYHGCSLHSGRCRGSLMGTNGPEGCSEQLCECARTRACVYVSATGQEDMDLSQQLQPQSGAAPPLGAAAPPLGAAAGGGGAAAGESRMTVPQRRWGLAEQYLWIMCVSASECVRARAHTRRRHLDTDTPQNASQRR